MQKITTSEKKTNLLIEKNLPQLTHEMQPSTEALNKILQFASSYRVQQIGKNQFVGFFLN